MGKWQYASLIASSVLIALTTGVVSLESTTVGFVSLKIQNANVVYGLLWATLLGSVVFSWPSALKSYAALKHSALSIANGLTHEKIVAFGVTAYPNFQEKAGHFKYSEMPRTGFLRREASIIIGTQPDGTAKLGTYDVRVWSLLPELISACLRATFVEGGYAIFLPYVAAVAAVLISLATKWPGSAYELFRKIYA